MRSGLGLAWHCTPCGRVLFGRESRPGSDACPVCGAHAFSAVDPVAGTKTSVVPSEDRRDRSADSLHAAECAAAAPGMAADALPGLARIVDELVEERAAMGTKARRQGRGAAHTVAKGTRRQDAVAGHPAPADSTGAKQDGSASA